MCTVCGCGTETAGGKPAPEGHLPDHPHGHHHVHAHDHRHRDDGGLAGVLFIENVGNLVCPSAFDLGEAHKVMVLSITGGEDKPLKYPDMFAAADLMLLNKSDLPPHHHFDVAACIAAELRVNSRLQILPVSARTGEGLAAFYAWIEARAALARAVARRSHAVERHDARLPPGEDVSGKAAAGGAG
jgi:hydrogenase nickel incorporation protein HypB